MGVGVNGKKSKRMPLQWNPERISTVPKLLSVIFIVHYVHAEHGVLFYHAPLNNMWQVLFRAVAPLNRTHYFGMIWKL